MESLKAISWHVNGLNSAGKRKQVFNWLKKQKGNLIGIQETHIKNKDNKYLKNKYIGEEFYSLFEKKKRGVVIYANKFLKPEKLFSDSQGRYIAIKITYQKEKKIVINLYAPNGSKVSFFQEIQRQIELLMYESIILGEFNGTINNNLDRSGARTKKRENNGKLPISFFELVQNEDLLYI